MVDIMSKAKEAQVVDSIMEAIKLANGGMRPSEAIAKVATDSGYGKDIACRMVEAFNVSKTRKHQKEAAGEARAANIDIASPDEVLAIMYPDTVEAPAVKAASAWVPSECGRVETRFFTSPAPRLSNEKPADSHDGEDPDILMERAIKESEHLTALDERTRAAMALARLDLMSSFRKLAEYFRQLYHEPFADVEKAAVIKYGARARALMDIVFEQSRLPVTELRAPDTFEKSASIRETPATRMVDEAVRATDHYVDAARIHVKAADARAKFYKDFELRRELFAKLGFVKQALRPRLFTDTMSSLLGNVAATKLTEQRSPAEALAQAREDVIDPELEAERKTISARLMLNDLMRNDEVLSRLDPRRVVGAYNDIVGLVPRAADSPLILRSLLRKAVESTALDPYELQQMVQMEGSLAKLEPGSEPLSGESPKVDIKALIGG